MRKVLALLATSVFLASPVVAAERNFVTLGEAIYDFDGITASLRIPIMTGGALNPMNFLAIDCVEGSNASVGFSFAEPETLAEKGIMMVEAGDVPLFVERYSSGDVAVIALTKVGMPRFLRTLYDNKPVTFTYQGAGADPLVFTLHPEFGTEARRQIAGMHSVCELLGF